MLGPVLGSLIYAKAGYELTFYIFGGILGAALIIVIIILPWSLNHTKVNEVEIMEKEVETRNTMQRMIKATLENKPRPDPAPVAPLDISYSIFFRNSRAMVACISAMFSMIFMLFFDSILSNHLKKDIGIEEENIGTFLTLTL
jgi:MFS family permease